MSVGDAVHFKKMFAILEKWQNLNFSLVENLTFLGTF